MEFRRSGERRRRVLMDESRLEGDRPASLDSSAARGDDLPAPKEVGALGYAGAARREQQPRITDLIPTRRWAALVVGLSLAVIWTGLQALYGYTQHEVIRAPSDLLRAFDLERVDSLAGWYATLQLAAMGVAALGIFSMRRHRLDDYRGRYRVWLWVAASCWLASIEVTAGLRLPLGTSLARLTGLTLDPVALWWWIPVSLGTMLCLIRTTLEVRRSRGSAALVLLAGAGYLLVLVDQVYPLLPAGTARGMAISGAWLAAHSCALFGLLIYARFVYLEAHGLIQTVAPRARRQKTPRAERPAKVPRKSRAKAHSTAEPATAVSDAGQAEDPADAVASAGPKSSANAKEKSSIGAVIRGDASASPAAAAKSAAKSAANTPSRSESNQTQRAAQRSASAATAAVTGRDEDEDGQLDGSDRSDATLSRADRRRLKKELRRQNRAAA